MSTEFQFLAYLLIISHAIHLQAVNAAATSDELKVATQPRQSSFWEWLQGIVNPTSTTTTTTQIALIAGSGQCASCQCGLINHNRIVGGQQTEVHAYPWMAMLLSNNNFYCGATLISDRYVATAAHCVKGFSQGAISVRLLEHDRRNSSVYAINRRAAGITMHERYSNRNYDNDIALIRLSEPVEWNERLRPVCLPNTDDESYEGETAVVTGWGAIREGGPTAQKLQEVEVPVLSQDACRNSNYDASQITENMLCAGYDEGSKDSCQGDSGGPLHIRMKDSSPERYLLAGVVSWGEGCARPGRPGVYTRVNRYLDWISESTRDACGCDMMENMEETSSTQQTVMSSTQQQEA